MPDMPRRPGSRLPTSDAIPDEIDDTSENQSVGTRTQYVELVVRDINRRLKEGDRQLANLKNTDEGNSNSIYNLEKEFSSKLEAVRRELEGKDFTNRRELEAVIIIGNNTTEMEIAKLRDEVSPRMGLWRVLGYIAVIVIPTFIAIAGWVWTASKYPNRDEFDKLQEKVQLQKEEIIKINAAHSKSPSTPGVP